MRAYIIYVYVLHICMQCLKHSYKKMVDDEISHTAESYVNGGLSTIESILVVSRFNVGAGGRHYHRNPKNLQRNCSMSWAIFFCLPHPWLGDNFCVHWLYSLVSCWANIFVCSSSYGNNFCVHWLRNLFLVFKIHENIHHY